MDQNDSPIKALYFILRWNNLKVDYWKSLLGSIHERFLVLYECL